MPRYSDRANIVYLDFTFSADKSVSLAWAFAETEAERAIIMRAHHDAVQAAMAHAEGALGWTRRRNTGEGHGNDSGEIVRVPGEIGWIEFDHYTARPTAQIAVTEPDGRPATVLQTVMVAGTPQLHTHVGDSNVVLTADGHVGAIARGLRWAGEGVRRLLPGPSGAEPAPLRRGGGAAAREDRRGAPGRHTGGGSDRLQPAHAGGRAGCAPVCRAARAGLERLPPEQKIKLLKGGAKTTRQGKGDDLGDGRPGRSSPMSSPGNTARCSIPTDAGYPDRTASVSGAPTGPPCPSWRRSSPGGRCLPSSEARIAAARGLVAAGVADAGDIDAVTALMRTHGVRQDGRTVALIWGEDPAADGETRITTALHAEQETALVALARTAATDKFAALDPAAIEKAVVAAGRRDRLDFSGEHGRARSGRSLITSAPPAGWPWRLAWPAPARPLC